MFLIAAIVSLPKQLVAVYLGYALQEDNGRTSPSSHSPFLTAHTRAADNTKGSRAVKYVAVAIYVVLSLIAMRYLRVKQFAIREPVVYERRKRRQAGKPDPSPSELEEGAGQAPMYAPKAQRAAPEAVFAPGGAYPPAEMAQPQHASGSGMAVPTMPKPTVPLAAHTAPNDAIRR